MTSLRTADISKRHRRLVSLSVQALVFVVQFVVGVKLAGNGHDENAVREIAELAIVFFLIGIARAWELIGARDTRLFGVLRAVALDRAAAEGRSTAQKEPADP